MAAEGGEEDHTLQTEEMASHSHDISKHNATGSVNAINTTGDASLAHALEDYMSEEGGDTPHNNMPPYVSVNFIIKT